MARSFTVSFNIHGAMDGSLQAALQAAANAMRGLGNAAKNASAAAAASKSGLAGMAAGLNQLQAAAQRYKQIQDALKQSTADFSAAGLRLSSAKAKYDADAAAVDKLKQKLDELKKAQAKLGTDKSSGNATLKQLRQDLANLKKAYADAKKAGDAMKMSTLGAQIKSTQGAITAQQASVKAMAQAYRELSEKVKQAKAELKAANEAAQKSGSDLAAARSNAQKLSQNFQSQFSALNQLKAQLTAAGFNVSSFAASESRLAGDIDRVNAALQRQQQLMNAQNRSAQASQEMFNAYNNFQSALDTATQIASPFQSAAENAITFEHAMSKVKSLTQMRDIRAGNLDKVNASMQALTEMAETLGATTEFTSTEVAQAMGKLGMAGWDDKRINAAMSSIVDLATIADNHNIQRTADIVSDDMTALGIKAGESMTLASGKVVDGVGYFSDAFAYATTQANLDQELLHEALKYNAPGGHTAGLSIGESFAQNMIAANSGIKGSMAGTSFRAGWTRLLAPPKTAMKSLQEMGLSASEATKQIRESQEALQEAGASIDDDLFTKIKKAQAYYQTLDKNARAGWLKNLVGQNALSGWQIAFEKGNFKDIERIAKEIDSGAIEGWAADTAAVMRDDTKTAVELLKSSLDALQRSVGQALTPAIRAAAEAFAPLVTAASQFIAQNPEIVQAAAAIAAALATVVVGAAAVKLAFAGWTFITSSIALVRTSLAALSSGAMFGGLIARLAAVRTALLGLTAAGGLATFGGWATMFTRVAAAARTFSLSMVATQAALYGLKGLSVITATISSIGMAIAGAARAAMSFAFSPVGVALMALALAGLYCYQNWDKVSAAFGKIAGVISGALGPAITQVQTALNALSSSGGFAALSNAASQAASVIGGTLVKAFAVVLTVAASAIATIIQLLADLVTIIADIGTGLSDAIGKISEGDFSGAFDALTSAGSKAFADLKQMGNHVFDGVEQGAKNVQAVIDALNSNVTVASQAATSAGSNMATGLLAATPAPQAAAAPETAPIDTSATQAALDQVSDSASNAASQMQTMQQATAGVDQMAAQFAAAGTGVEQLSTSAQTAGTGIQQLSADAQQSSAGIQQLSTNAQQAGTAAQQMATSAQNAASGTDALGNSAQNATGGIEALSSSAAGAVGSISGLGSAASGASGAISGLGAAAQAACAQLAAAGANAAAQVSAAAASAGGGVKANYKGGIYPKGQFLTTFAEKSPEAAIPIDNSKRARDLWTKTGQMLGMLPGNGGSYDSAEKDAYGNIVGMDIPEYNKIGAGDTEDVKIDKRRVQREQYESEVEKQKIIRQQTITAATEQLQAAAQIQAAAPKNIPASDFDSAAKDEFGNVVGLNIPEYNRITGDDTVPVKRDKIRAQREQYDRERAKRDSIKQISVTPPEVQKQAIEITRAARENYFRQRLGNSTQIEKSQALNESFSTAKQVQIAAETSQVQTETANQISTTQSEVQKQAIEITRTARENYFRQRLGNSTQIEKSQALNESLSTAKQVQIAAETSQVQTETANQISTTQSEVQKQAIEITRTARENYFRQRLGGRRVPTAASERRLSPAEHNRQLREQVLSGKKPLDAAINEVQMPSGATIGEAMKYLPPQNNRVNGVVSERNYPRMLDNPPLITTPPFLPTDSPITKNRKDFPKIMTPPTVPTRENNSDDLRATLTQVLPYIPGFKGNIGGFDIVGGLTGGNLFGSFGALDGKFGGLLNKIGSVGNFGALGDLGGGLMHMSEVGSLGDLTGTPFNSSNGQSSAPPEFNVTINVTVNGKADENAAKNIAQQTVSAFNDWADNYFAFQHDAARRSFA